MPKTPQNVNKTITKLRGLFAVMAAVLVASIMSTFLVGQQALIARDKVKQHDENLAQLHATLSALQDAETGQRGYLLTGKDAYLAPYEDATAVIRKRLDGLQELAAAKQLASETVQEIKKLVALKLGELQHTIELAQTGQKEASLKTVKSDTGLELMDDLRSKFSELETQQDTGRAEAHHADERATQFRTAMFLFTALINLAFLAWAYSRIRREMSLQYVATLETERQREILAVTLASIGDAVIITDTAGQITFINKVAEDLTGWTAQQARNESCARVFHIINEYSREPVDSPVDKVLASGAIVGLANHTLLIRKDGSEVPIDDSGAPIREKDGTVRGVVLVFRDFSAYKEAEHNLILSKQQVEEASKAKDTFLATLSHELRTPLTPVLVTLSTWEANQKLPPALQPDLKLIRRNVELEAKLIDDLLDITRIEHGKLFLDKSPVDAHGLVNAVAGLFRSECLANGVQLSISTKAERSFVEADPARIQQIFWNIIGNAVKFTSNGGHITVQTSNLPTGELEIRVEDDGSGMTQETLGSVFQSFRQGEAGPNKKPRGLGLGLSIAHALVEAHGGTLQAASKGPDEGSTFTIVLPTVSVPSAHASLATNQVVPMKKMRILLLEDHEDTAQVLGQVMSGMGHTVEICSTVSQAREKIGSQEFDIILSDLGLPDGTGINFIRFVRETSQTPAVALTGYGMAEDIENCLKAGFDDHLTKPVDFKKLQKTLQKTSRRNTSA